MSSMENPAAKANLAAVTQQEAAQPSVLDQIIAAGRFSKAPERGVNLVDAFVQQIMDGTVTLGKDVEATIDAKIRDIDELLSLQMDEILHNEAFQKLEASWRGLRYLLDQSETGQLLRIKVLNITKRELLKDFQKAPEFDQSSLFQKVYEEGFGVYGGAPFGALVGDYEFGRHPEDVELLEHVSGTAAAAHCPFVAAANPEMLNLEDFTQLNSIRDVSTVFMGTDTAKWKSFRASDDSRYVGLTMPHMLMRLPYGQATRQAEGFNYEEAVDGTNHKKYLWGNAAFALASKMTQAFAENEFCTAIRGPEGGGKVEGLPVHNFKTWEGDIAMKCPLEVQIPDRREKELADQGFIPLVHCKDTDYAAFFSVQSAQKPKLWNTDEANANARLSAQLPYIFAICRFAHYMKVMMRNKIGRNMSKGDLQRYLQTWISEYVLAQDDATHEQKAKRPLRAAAIEVDEDPAKPGVYRTTMFLRPHLQLDELNVSLRLVAELPKNAK
jgi:type VI secretion system protein ImpC